MYAIRSYYEIHMSSAKEITRNVSLVFAKRVMWDVDNFEDLEFLLNHKEKPEIIKKIQEVLGSK